MRSHGKNWLFGHICQMPGDRIIKNLIFVTIEDTGKKRRPNRECLDDIHDWCQVDIQHMYHMTQNKTGCCGRSTHKRHWTPNKGNVVKDDDAESHN